MCGAVPLGQMQHHPGSPTGLASIKVGAESERESRTWDGPRGQVLHWVRRRCLKVADSWGRPTIVEKDKTGMGDVSEAVRYVPRPRRLSLGPGLFLVCRAAYTRSADTQQQAGQPGRPAIPMPSAYTCPDYIQPHGCHVMFT